MSDDQESWKIKAAEEVTEERHSLLILRKQRVAEHQQEIRRIDDKLSDLTVSARALGLPVTWLNEERGLTLAASDFLVVHHHGPNVREAVAKPPPFKNRALELLAEAYPAPMKAAEIRSKIEAETRSKFHEKTAGMSLYRLSRDGLVRREGKDLWFFVPEDQRNKENPGSGSQPEDPGSLL
ncbi:MAG: hypothetical protein Q8J92_01790 [Parvibaculum sp.]|nr:hypothetical protein [Parvibaculum sp.]